MNGGPCLACGKSAIRHTDPHACAGYTDDPAVVREREIMARGKPAPLTREELRAVLADKEVESRFDTVDLAVRLLREELAARAGVIKHMAEQAGQPVPRQEAWCWEARRMLEKLSDTLGDIHEVWTGADDRALAEDEAARAAKGAVRS